MARETRPKDYPKLKNYQPTRFMLPTSHYDKAKADRAVAFIENLCHTKGKWAGKRFWLLPWQEQLIRDIFGIVKPDGNRQFRTAFVEICKKLVGVMDIALMNEKVVFQKCSVVKDGIGNHRNEWTEDYCCFATIGGEGLASSREAETAGTVVEDVGMTVTVRYCKKTAGIRSVTHRILFRDQMYDIVSVDHLNYKKKCLKFTCRKVRG